MCEVRDLRGIDSNDYQLEQSLPGKNEKALVLVILTRLHPDSNRYISCLQTVGEPEPNAGAAVRHGALLELNVNDIAPRLQFDNETIVLVPAATSFGPSYVVDSSPYPVPSIAWTRFRHANMNIASEKISPLHTAFRPRQRRADMPPIARWDPRAAKFLAIRASQPPVSSRAACARYRLGRKTADRHNALMRRFDRLRRDLTELNTTILRLYDTHTILPPSILANVIHDVERASSLYRTLRAAAAVDIIPEDISLPSTLLHGSLKPSTPPCVPSSTLVDFFGG
ncbi:hypothetical protein B0H16DRAFT_1844688 [Mycena metata]|uniref:Uncharacterized protein n=1 Tax=Mycena metata TaxID=1033252 RepID=A0AAD7N8D3_9AGAR|nr:hypothetical protein B0H16DRAFT_1844688 [Mycena metata]